ncbi:NAD(P)H-dependent oxidoreductase [Peteryoungia desertarenae]|uniref:NAD(P)H-dependent oxidoreductase n=1 Tax=Peteryoungia desertarenae TaxID=1813451 RepID=A0ABX6QPR7_9HYPH|nr:NAD(P)H-dependent oxidoreductase [Peteryoungia desertarenae]QLF70513.1 NAD(P)H-dependent oxidoreductase [Peteryoungia desertarenae]
MSFLSTSGEASRLLVLNGNPGEGTLCGSMADAIAAKARAMGAEVRIVHLKDLNFDGNLAQGYHQRMDWEPDLAAFAESLTWCDRFVLVHPLWWGSAPAKLKGLFDRVLMPGFGFEYVEGKALPKPLLAGRKARVVITSDTPTFFLKWIYGNGWVKVLRRQILAFCGFKDLKVKYFSPVRGAKPEALAKMVDEAAGILG